jgi:hypothetical protein
MVNDFIKPVHCLDDSSFHLPQIAFFSAMWAIDESLSQINIDISYDLTLTFFHGFLLSPFYDAIAMPKKILIDFNELKNSG